MATSLATLGGANPLSMPSGGYKHVSSKGSPYGGGASGFKNAFSLTDLMSAYNKFRPYQDVALPGAPEPPRPTAIGLPNKKLYAGADRSALVDIRNQMAQSRSEFYNPTQSGAFKNLMSLASTRTARGAEEADRRGREAAGRRGFVGGLSAETERTSRDRMRELAATGFEGAHAIREQAGSVYGQQMGAYASVANAVLEADTQSSLQYAGDLLRSKIAQGELDQGYGNQLIALYKAKTDAVLGQGGLRETARGHDLEALTGLARAGMEGYRDQNQLALLREKYGLEELAATKAEERRRASTEWDFAFKKKHSDEDLGMKAKAQGMLDPRTEYLRRAAGGNPFAELALKNRF